ncbi:MAG: hypothetical protein IT422_19690 [Pirellulaceae bacterium]|jgi:hypothetical protein|nr:hypothetical protein [Pirellulaceae bacterium]
MKITKPLQRVLSQIEEQHSELHNLCAQQLIDRQLESQKNIPEHALAFVNQIRHGLYAKCSDDQWTLFTFSNFISFIHVNSVAAYRRIKYDLPIEYAMLVALSARAEWMAAKVNWKYTRDELWRPILLAACVHDRTAVERLLAHWEARQGKPSNRAYEAICLGVEALLKRDTGLLKTAVEESAKRKTASYVKGINMVLAGIDAANPELTAQGFDQMLKRFRGYMFDDQACALIDPFAHGLFELAKSYSPKCLESFDTRRRLPWDAEFSEWILSVDDISGELSKLRLPDFLREALIDMENMDWAPDNRPKD